MSNSYRREVARKLKEIVATSKDEKTVIEAANVLAKYLPKPKQPKRRPGTPVAPIKPKEPSLDELVVAMEKKRKEKPPSAGEQAALNGGSTEVA